jgi:hypothetical protein
VVWCVSSCCVLMAIGIDGVWCGVMWCVGVWYAGVRCGEVCFVEW